MMMMWSRDGCWTKINFFHNVQMQRMSGWCLCPEGKEVFFVGQVISSGPMVWIWWDCKTSEARNLPETWKLCLLERPHPWKFMAGTQKNEGFKKMILLFQRGDFQVSCYVTPVCFPVFSRCREACASNLAVLGKVDLTPKREREIMQKAIRMMHGFGVFFPLDFRCPLEMPAKCLLN